MKKLLIILIFNALLFGDELGFCKDFASKYDIKIKDLFCYKLIEKAPSFSKQMLKELQNGLKTHCLNTTEKGCPSDIQMHQIGILPKNELLKKELEDCKHGCSFFHYIFTPAEISAQLNALDALCAQNYLACKMDIYLKIFTQPIKSCEKFPALCRVAIGLKADFNLESSEHYKDYEHLHPKELADFAEQQKLDQTQSVQLVKIACQNAPTSLACKQASSEFIRLNGDNDDKYEILCEANNAEYCALVARYTNKDSVYERFIKRACELDFHHCDHGEDEKFIAECINDDLKTCDKYIMRAVDYAFSRGGHFGGLSDAFYERFKPFYSAGCFERSDPYLCTKLAILERLYIYEHFYDEKSSLNWLKLLLNPHKFTYEKAAKMANKLSSTPSLHECLVDDYKCEYFSDEQKQSACNDIKLYHSAPGCATWQKKARKHLDEQQIKNYGYEIYKKIFQYRSRLVCSDAHCVVNSERIDGERLALACQMGDSHACMLLSWRKF